MIPSPQPVFSPYCCLFPADPAEFGAGHAADVAKAFGLTCILCVWPDPKAYPCRLLDLKTGDMGPRFELSEPLWAVWAFCPAEQAGERFLETLRFAAAEGCMRAGFVSPAADGFAAGIYRTEAASRAVFPREWPAAPSAVSYPRGCSPDHRLAAGREISGAFLETAELLSRGMADDACARLRGLADSIAADAFGAEPDPDSCRRLAEALQGTVPEFDRALVQGFDLDNRAFRALAEVSPGALRSAIEKNALQTHPAACGRPKRGL